MITKSEKSFLGNVIDDDLGSDMGRAKVHVMIRAFRIIYIRGDILVLHGNMYKA